MSFDSKKFNASLQKSLDAFANHMSKLRVGRATPALIDSVQFEVYGQKMSLKSVASIEIASAMALRVRCYDSSNNALAKKAIMQANLGFGVQEDSTDDFIVTVPPMTEENRANIVKSLKTQLEQCKIAFRNIRKDARNDIDKFLDNKEISEDEAKRFEKSIDEDIKKINSEAEKKYELKVKEIQSI